MAHVVQPLEWNLNIPCRLSCKRPYSQKAPVPQFFDIMGKRCDRRQRIRQSWEERHRRKWVENSQPISISLYKDSLDSVNLHTKATFTWHRGESIWCVTSQGDGFPVFVGFLASGVVGVCRLCGLLLEGISPRYSYKLSRLPEEPLYHYFNASVMLDYFWQ